MRKKQISIVLLLAMAFVMASPMIGDVQASPTTIIEVLPETTVVGIGEDFTVDVNISDAVDLYGFQFVLRYDPNILSVIDVNLPTGGLFYIDKEFNGVPVWDGYDCDVVEDGVLDIYDFVAFADAYGSVEGDPNYNPRADIDGDGDVDEYDFLIFAAAWVYVDMPGTIQFLREPEAWEGGTFATVTFEAIGPGETMLDLDNVKLSTDMGEPIPHEIRDGTVTVLSPAESIQHLIDQVQAFNLQQGIENSLDKKLQAVQDALTALNAEQRNDAINKLNALINEIETQRDNKITTEQADLLIASAQAIIDVLI